MNSTDRRRTLGALGESLARVHLEARGYEVVDANFRTRHGELDLVVADGRSVVFCEVKTRLASAWPRGELGPLAGVDARKRRQVRHMAREWLAARGDDRPQRAELRFDAIGIEVDASGALLSLEHLEGAF